MSGISEHQLILVSDNKSVSKHIAIQQVTNCPSLCWIWKNESWYHRSSRLHVLCLEKIIFFPLRKWIQVITNMYVMYNYIQKSFLKSTPWIMFYSWRVNIAFYCIVFSVEVLIQQHFLRKESKTFLFLLDIDAAKKDTSTNVIL